MYSEEIYKNFLAHCDNGFIILDQDSAVADVNNALCELTGREREELVDSGMEILFDGFSAERITSIYNAYECSEICHTISGELLQKKGTPRDVEILINCSKGERWLLVKNKSFRREMEDKLRQSELMLSTTLESLPFDFWINDAENRTYMQNSYSKNLWGDVKGAHPEEVGADDRITRHWLDTIERAFRGEVVNGEIEYHIDSKSKFFRNILAPIKDGENLLGILGMNIDITDLKEALQMRDMLLKEVHHRVKNNLQMISSIINLENENLNSKKEKAILNNLKSRIEAISLIHEKLYLTESNIINSADYIQDLVDYIISGVDVDGIILDYKLENIEINLDVIIILGLILNELVTNSVKYAFRDEGRHILGISFSKIDDKAELVVSDNGPGIDEGSSKAQGTKLGLKMMDVFAEQLDGELLSDCSSEGCRFILRFPLKKAEA